MSQGKSLVTIKGTKDGLTFLLDDRCSFEQLEHELKEKLSSNYYKSEKDDPHVYVKVNVGNRYITDSDREKLEQLITSESHLRIDQYESAVVTLKEAKAMEEQAQTVTMVRMIRSGQVVTIKGNVLLIGDVNPGGLLVATGNIYVMGALKGKVHAGSEGNEQAMICAAVMTPTHLQIASTWRNFADQTLEETQMRAAFLNKVENEIVIEKVQGLLDVEFLREKEAVS
ncbi:septum site-determining protein MinC [Bacillus sp. JCM 19046]|uniref:Probable septum site-determining protein MinC n=1 Tax=Shouchella xiaoxiensis TaxID=766895 RepID=A0ABS2STJ8_9BACI|nr:septum site-determining protein MinC [Shouchella xiaoxiensis]MBM7838580.1 septum site-determining protein MinC [Shouchella xiaoxiensis]GAF13365.1 septum site-determining protein MinC [Bacillus sp. JCM 19045]GAF19690.1 septum site-determining protein MinC [Bacillus sp. JCM 19046]